MRSIITTSTLSLLALTLAACGDDGASSGNEEEVITTVTLTFTPASGGGPIVASFDDADGDGGNPPVIDQIALAPGSYATTVRFLNKLEDPPEEITDEVRDESDQHQLFFTGTAVVGPASDSANAALTQSYDDTDVNALPIGLANTFVASTGTGNLTVTLQHLPPLNGTAVKVAGLADTVRTSGLGALPGEADANVTFAVTVSRLDAR